MFSRAALDTQEPLDLRLRSNSLCINIYYIYALYIIYYIMEQDLKLTSNPVYTYLLYIYILHVYIIYIYYIYILHIVYYMMELFRIFHLNGRNSGKIGSTYKSCRKFQFGCV